MIDKYQHGAGFLASGVLAFATDAVVLLLLTRLAGVDPFSARVVAIGTAMIVAYFAHRTLTFKVSDAPTLAQFAKFASVGAGVSVLNYLIYAGLLFAFATITPLLALTIASAIAMVASYLGYRYGVFQKPTP